jgi:hypothetical protein
MIRDPHYVSSSSLANSTAVTLRAALFGFASDAPGRRCTAGAAEPANAMCEPNTRRKGGGGFKRTRREQAVNTPAQSGWLALGSERDSSGGVRARLCELRLELL